MKNLFKKVAVLTMALMFVLTSAFAVTGCGKKTGSTNSETEIEILYWESGMGIEFLQKMKESFEAKYPEYTIYINATADLTSVIGDKIIMGRETGDTVDLYMGTGAAFMAVKEELVDFNDLLDTTIPGENLKLGEKIYSDFLAGQVYDGKTWALPWLNAPMSIVYNKSVFDAMGYEIPRTTDELAELAVTIQGDGQSATGIVDETGKKLTQPNSTNSPAPFIHARQGYEYWGSILYGWVAQYEGFDNYNEMLGGNWIDPETGIKYEKSINSLGPEGKLKAIQALEKAIAPVGHSYPQSNAYDHTTAQTYFLNNAAIMMPNGAWLENEMREHQTSHNYAMMKLPVISALGEKLGISDSKLAQIVDYVDGTTTEKPVVNSDPAKNDAIIERVREARFTIFNNGASQRFLLPKYSNCVEGVQKFLLHFYSDEGLAIYMNYSKSPAPAKFADETKKPDLSSWSSFTKSCAELTSGMNNVCALANNEFFTKINISGMWNTSVPTFLTAVNDADKLTAVQIFKKDMEYFKQQWPIICQVLNIVDTADSVYRAVDLDALN